MRPAELLSIDRIRSHPVLAGKAAALEELSALLAAGACLDRGQALASLLEREALGSTGFGRGVAIPHGRVKNSDRCVGAFIRLGSGIEFAAPDDRPVDLLFGLLVPEAAAQEHLTLLAQLAEMFSNETLVAALRAATTTDALHRLLSDWRPCAA